VPSVLITGAGQGLGRELVRVYAANGWTTFPLVRKPEDVRQLAADHSPDCFPIVGDVGEDAVEKSIADALEAHSESLDVLINNAGNIKKERGLLRAEASDMLDHFNVHCIGALRCSRACLPFLRKAPRPVIVNITSRRGSISRTPFIDGGLIYAYKIAKAAQNMLTACLSEELRADKIRVFAIHPGGLKTSVAPPDADVEPSDAALRLSHWIDDADDTLDCACYDLTTGEIIDW
jgi:NAD(P)-dependent dehydrogenase (short-subunit alcohol dehydrogenase family)